MKMRSSTFFVSLVVTCLAVQMPCNAQVWQPYIEITPSYYDFGNVQVGDSSTTMITIANVGQDPLSVHSIVFQTADHPGFWFNNPGSVVLEPPNGHLDKLEMEVRFAPIEPGAASAVLIIYSNDPDTRFTEVPLRGVGITDEISIEDIIIFFDQSVEAGTLQGNVKCHKKCRYRWHHKCDKKCDHKSKCEKAARMRLKLFRRMLVATKYALDKGWTKWACFFLRRAYLRSDGQVRPRDYVIGEASPELASMINQLGDILGCEL